MSKRRFKNAISACLILILMLVNILSLSAQETPDWGFYTKDEQRKTIPLSGLSTAELSANGLTLSLDSLAPVFQLENASIMHAKPLEEGTLDAQIYHATLIDAQGSPCGYALLRYNYYSPDSEFIQTRVEQDTGFMQYYEEQVKDRYEIIEMKQTDVSLDIAAYKDTLQRVMAKSGIDQIDASANLANLVDGLGYAIRISSGQSIYYYLIDQTRTRDELGLTAWIEASELENALNAAPVQVQSLPDDADEPPIGGGAGVLQTAESPRLHGWVIAVAALLLVAAGGLVLISRRKER